VTRTVFVGSGPFGGESLRTLAAATGSGAGGLDLVGVVTAPARRAGRGGTLNPTPIASLAADLGVGPVLAPERLRAPDAVADVLALRPDLLVVADYGQLVPPALFELSLGALNVHPSRLPRHRGASPIPATILAGDADTAVTIIRLDAGLDTGPIVAVSEPLEVGDGATTPELEAALAALGADLLRRTLPDWIRGTIAPVPQPDDGSTLTRPLRREDGRIDPSRPAFVLEREVRAYRPWPGSFLDAEPGERIAILRASVGESRPGDRPGLLVPDDDGLALATVDGRLRIIEAQPAGGRPMPIAALLRGRPALRGAVVRRTGATMADR
jgi:methionyl-tRNA formyltransferase